MRNRNGCELSLHICVHRILKLRVTGLCIFLLCIARQQAEFPVVIEEIFHLVTLLVALTS